MLSFNLEFREMLLKDVVRNVKCFINEDWAQRKDIWQGRILQNWLESQASLYIDWWNKHYFEWVHNSFMSPLFYILYKHGIRINTWYISCFTPSSWYSPVNMETWLSHHFPGLRPRKRKWVFEVSSEWCLALEDRKVRYEVGYSDLVTMAISTWLLDVFVYTYARRIEKELRRHSIPYSVIPYEELIFTTSINARSEYRTCEWGDCDSSVFDQDEERLWRTVTQGDWCVSGEQVSW